MATNQPAVSFDEIIQEARKKKKAEKLAQEIFGRKGRASAPPSGPRGGLGASLASRIGVTKRTPSIPRAPTPRQHPRAPLHTRPSTQETQRPRLPHSKSATNGFERSKEQRLEQVEVRDAPPEKELFIKGAASGPYTVVAQNFASGTTAQDIEAVMLKVGGDMTSCKLVASNPTVIAEMTFVDRSGGQEVIDTFNGKQADGQALYVYWKRDGGAVSSRPERRETVIENPDPVPPVEVEEEAMEVDENAAAREAEDRHREERRARDARDARYDRDDRRPREMFPSEPREYRAHMDQYDDRRMNQHQQGYQSRGYGFGGRGYGYGYGQGYRGAPRGGWGDSRYGGGQSWRP